MNIFDLTMAYGIILAATTLANIIVIALLILATIVALQVRKTPSLLLKTLTALWLTLNTFLWIAVVALYSFGIKHFLVTLAAFKDQGGKLIPSLQRWLDHSGTTAHDIVQYQLLGDPVVIVNALLFLTIMIILLFRKNHRRSKAFKPQR